VKINFSRHAKRRAKLYDIPESVLSDVLAGMKLPQGEHTFVKDVVGFKYPLKIIVSTNGDVVTVVTSYPLKKGKKR
jgi:hypothetical protein